MASTWVVLCEIDGTLQLSLGDTAGEAERMAHAALTAPEKVRAAAAGVIKMDHTLRAAQVVTYKRGGRELVAADEKSRPPASTVAYDIICTFGYDIDKELKAGNPPPPEKISAFVQKLNLPIVMAKKTEKVDTPPARTTAVADVAEKRRKTMIIATVVVLALVAVGVILVFKAL